MSEYLVDTNVLSKIFYGNSLTKKFVEQLSVGVDTVVYIECIQGSISNTDKKLIKASLQRLKFYGLSGSIAQTAVDLIDRYSNSRGLLLADALIAATALEYNLTLITLNTNDFNFIDGLTIIEPAV